MGGREKDGRVSLYLSLSSDNLKLLVPRVKIISELCEDTEARYENEYLQFEGIFDARLTRD
jgi:hypothetical protein